MNEIFMLNLIDILRDIIKTDFQALDIFGSNLGADEDSAVDCLFARYFHAEESIQYLLVSAIFEQAGVHEDLEETELTDIILDRFFDDDVRSGNVSSQALLDEFLAEAEDYLYRHKGDNV